MLCRLHCHVRSAGDAIRFHASRDVGRESVNAHVEAREEGRRLLTRRTSMLLHQVAGYDSTDRHIVTTAAHPVACSRRSPSYCVCLVAANAPLCTNAFKNQSFINNDEDDADAIQQLADTSASAAVIISQTTTTPTPPPFPFLNVFLVFYIFAPTELH